MLIHPICHKETHSALRGTGLARSSATAQALRSYARPAEWMARRPPGFFSQGR